MNKCLIVTSHVEHLENISIDGNDYNEIICADKGYLIAGSLGLEATLLIGDYDSMKQPERSVIKLPSEKDMTDSEAAIDLAVSRGNDDITVLGGIGGRLDHTMGNIGMLAKYCGHISHLTFVDGQNAMFMITPGSIMLPKNKYKYLGVIAYGGSAVNVTLKGVKYPLSDHLLTDDTTLGVSNEIIDEAAEISFDAGKLLIIMTNDVDK